MSDARHIIDTAVELNLTFDPAYVGRGMFNKTCVAVHLNHFEDYGRVMFHLGALNEQTAEEDIKVADLTQEIFHVRYDSFGRDKWIMYWPRIATPEEVLEQLEYEADEEEAYSGVGTGDEATGDGVDNPKSREKDHEV